MIQHQILVRARYERGEAFDELARLEEQMRGAVTPRALELELDLVTPKLEAFFREGRPEEIAASVNFRSDDGS